MRKIAFLAIFSRFGLSLRHPAAGFAVTARRNAGFALEGERQRHVGAVPRLARNLGERQLRSVEQMPDLVHADLLQKAARTFAELPLEQPGEQSARDVRDPHGILDADEIHIILEEEADRLRQPDVRHGKRVGAAARDD